MPKVHAIVLAAGQGTRMKSAKPKVLHALAGTPMLGHVLAAARGAGTDTIHLVLGHGIETIRNWLFNENSADLAIAVQAEQLGTAHAVQQALAQVPDDVRVVVLYGDVPLVPSATIRRVVEAAGDGLAMLTVTLDAPKGYGRILREPDSKGGAGRVTGIVEESDASEAQRAIREVNTGIIAAPARRLKRWLSKVRNENAKREYYLTDAIALAVKDGVTVATVSADAPEDVEGVNDPVQLARLERVLQRRQADALMRAGLYLADPARFDLRGTLRHGRDVFVDVGCVFEGTVILGDGARIGPYCVLRDAVIGEGTEVRAHSTLDTAQAGAGCVIGPYARLRPGTRLAERVHVGNFVEIKQSTLGDDSKANHLAYIGDATVGARVNIGAGVITCNYDGVDKHPTEIGDDSFIGSDSQLVAPVVIGARAYIAAGSTIARDAPDDALTINRAREQKSFANWKPRKPRT